MAKTKLYDFQRQTVRAIEGFAGRALVVLDPGLGKTICALSFIARNTATPAVVCCPATVKYVWEHEAIKHAGKRVIVCEGRKPPSRSALLGSLADIYVVNYDILPYWLEYLRNLDPQTVVFDENQALMHPTSKRTKAARKLVATVPNVLALSGTPLMNRPADLWPSLNILRPDLYKTFNTYCWRYCAPVRKPWGWEFKGATNLDELHQELSENLMIRFRKADVLQGLPSKMREIVPCPLTIDAAAEYKHATSDFLSWLQQKNGGAVNSASKALAMTKLGYLLQLSAELKTQQVVDWSNAFLEDSDEKLVVFAYHKAMIAALKAGIGSKSVVIDGSITGRKRADAVSLFQHDSNVRVAICQLHAAGVGITLTAASTVAFTEVWWRPSDFTQAADRCHRIGQSKTVWEHWLIAPNTIEEKLCKILQEKQSVLSTVLDGGAQDSDLDVFSRLMESLKESPCN